MLIVLADVFEQIVSAARERAPYEIGGLIATDRAGVLVAAHPIGSPDATRARVRMSGSEIAAATEALERRDLRVAGTYHSHPSSRAVPSESDLRSLRLGELMLIVGLEGNRSEIRIWRLDEVRRLAEEVVWSAPSGTSFR